MMYPPVLAYFAPGPFEIALVGGIILLLFGNRLPGVMRSLGKSFVEFKKGVKGIEEDSDAVPGESAKSAAGEPPKTEPS